MLPSSWPKSLSRDTSSLTSWGSLPNYGHRPTRRQYEWSGCHAFQLKPSEKCVLIKAQSRQNRHSRQAMSRHCGHGRPSTLSAKGRSCIRHKSAQAFNIKGRAFGRCRCKLFSFRIAFPYPLQAFVPSSTLRLASGSAYVDMVM